MYNIIVKSYVFSLNCGFKELPIDLEQFRTELERHRLELLSYSEGAPLISKLGLTEYASYQKGFTYLSPQLKIIFYKDELPYGEKLFVIAHEIAHVVLSHTAVGLKGMGEELDLSIQEREADIFAYNLIAPLCVINRLHLNSVRDVKKITLLDDHYAKRVLKQAKGTKTKWSKEPTTKQEKDLLNQFEGFINDYIERNPRQSLYHKRHQYMTALIVILLLFIFLGVVNLRHRMDIMEQASATPIIPPSYTEQKSTTSPWQPETTPNQTEASHQVIQPTLEPTRQNEQTEVRNSPAPNITSEQSIPSSSPSISPTPSPFEIFPPTEKDAEEKIVYVTRYGAKYHTKDCKHIKNSIKAELPLEQAEKLYDPCKSCFAGW